MKSSKVDVLNDQIEQLLQAAQKDDLESRIIHSYLGSGMYSDSSVEQPKLLADVWLVALDGFLDDQGYDVEAAILPPSSQQHNSIGPVKTRMVEVAVDQHQSVLEDALVFLRDSDDGCMMLEVATDACDGSVEFKLFGDSSRAHDFFAKWEAYALRNAYLRGQRFYADGTLIRMDSELRLCDVRMTTGTRQQIEQTVLAFPRQVRRYKRYGVPAKRGLVLEGPPGTGKTMLCRALCSELDATFIWLTARHAQGGADVFAAVWFLARRLQPSVVLLEDLDLYSESRGHLRGNNLLGELMNQMDGVESSDGILTMATTNRIEVIEDALSNRPGRFDRVIHIGELEAEDRGAILRKHLAVGEVGDDAFDHLLDQTTGFTGAQVVDVVKTLIEIVDEDSQVPDDTKLVITREAVDQALEEMGSGDEGQGFGFAKIARSA